MRKKVRLTIRMLSTAIMFMVMFTAPVGGQEIIQNPGKPTASNAGRVLKFQEIWSVSDQEGYFYFKYPYRLSIASDGSIYLQDSRELLKFSPAGKFLSNLFKPGEGPGEMSDQFDYQLFRNGLVFYDLNKRKLWRTDSDGHLAEEIRLPAQDNRHLIGTYQGRFIFYREAVPGQGAAVQGFADIPHVILLTSEDGKMETEIYSFLFRRFLIPGGGMNFGNSIKSVSDDGRFIYGFHGMEYQVEVLDLETKTIVRRFQRDYDRVLNQESPNQKQFREKLGIPKSDFKADIVDLMPNGAEIWVATSTEKPDKSRMWDVFDDRGRYIDNFYLGAGRSLLKASSGTVFVLEKNADETLRLVKAKIVD